MKKDLRDERLVLKDLLQIEVITQKDFDSSLNERLGFSVTKDFDFL